MGKNVFLLMKERMPTFSKGQKRIATYIVENYDKAAFMTANTLGKAVGISESTVVRFATELGFDGYPELQKAMQKTALNRLSSSERRMPFGAGEEIDVLTSVLRNDAKALYETVEMMDHQSFMRAVATLSKAKRIYLMGSRFEEALIRFAGHNLGYLFQDVRTVVSSDSEEMIEQFMHIEAEDAVVVFGFSKSSFAIENGIRFCKEAGADVIAITNSVSSDVGQLAGVALVAKSVKASFIDSLVAPLSVINALVVALTSERDGQLQKRMDTLKRIREEYHVSEK